MATLYSFLIEHHLVPNVLVELYLLLELLTVKALEEGDDDVLGGMFCNIHNCVFFAAQVLKSQVTNTIIKKIYRLRFMLTL